MLLKLWIEIRSSLWFVPGLMVFAAVGLAIGLVEMDVAFAETLQEERWKPLLNAGADGARGMLTAIASSMITVAGVAFSVTIVTLSLASTQYTPRILRNFMRDRANQFVLGFFVAVYTYCLVVLRTIRGGGEENSGFVPLLAVAVGMVLALLSIACLIFFIHHIAASIQASTILQAITVETCSAIDDLFPERLEREEEPPREKPREQIQCQWPVPAHSTGYVQHVDTADLLRIAEECDAFLKIECKPGKFVNAGEPLMLVDHELDQNSRDSLCACFAIGDFRTVEQDPGFGIRQIVDIAIKALSPGVNDTSTAVSCLHYLGAILSKLGQRQIETYVRQNDKANRVTAPARSFSDQLAKALDQIRHSAAGNAEILIEILRVIRRVALATTAPARRKVLLQQAQLVCEQASLTLPILYDRERVNDALLETRHILGASNIDLPSCALPTNTPG